MQGRQHVRRQARSRRRQAVDRDGRDQGQTLEEARREHRPQHDRRRGKVVLREPRREAQAERRQQRPVGTDPREQRLGRHGRLGGRSQHDAKGLPAAELDDDGLPRLEAGQGRRDRVRVGPIPRGRRFDRDLHECGRGDPPHTVMRRSALRERSAVRTARMRPAVASTWPSSLTTT